MNNYLNNIIKNNSELLNNKMKKIDIGFTNLVYDCNNKYIIKICINSNNEKRFQNEIDFYLKNKYNKYIPKLYKYHIKETKYEYSYMILEKINGESLYFKWHSFNEEQRKDIINKISILMKSIHKIKYSSYDWSLFIKKKLIHNLKLCSKYKIFNENENKNINYIINSCSIYLKSNDLRLVHSDIHFDNILIDKNNNLKIIDFERSLFAPIDYELDIFLRMCNNPIKYANKDAEKYINIKDYINIPKYLKEFYPEIFDFEYYEIRHLVYDLETNMRLLPKFPEDKKLKYRVLNIINKLNTLL